MPETATVRLDTNAITAERLQAWRKVLDDSHATPVLLVAVGHDEREGELNVVVSEDCDTATLRLWLQYALRSL